MNNEATTEQPITDAGMTFATDDRGGDSMRAEEAASILARLARGRSRTEDEVSALQMGARRILARHFQRQRNWAKRRARREAEQAVKAEVEQ